MPHLKVKVPNEQSHKNKAEMTKTVAKKHSVSNQTNASATVKTIALGWRTFFSSGATFPSVLSSGGGYDMLVM